ncbi:MAG: hypothetical protein ACREN7_03855 [Candidatus Dormibacteria bacterium]
MASEVAGGVPRRLVDLVTSPWFARHPSRWVWLSPRAVGVAVVIWSLIGVGTGAAQVVQSLPFATSPGESLANWLIPIYPLPLLAGALASTAGGLLMCWRRPTGVAWVLLGLLLGVAGLALLTVVQVSISLSEQQAVAIDVASAFVALGSAVAEFALIYYAAAASWNSRLRPGSARQRAASAGLLLGILFVLYLPGDAVSLAAGVATFSPNDLSLLSDGWGALALAGSYVLPVLGDLMCAAGGWVMWRGRRGVWLLLAGVLVQMLGTVNNLVVLPTVADSYTAPLYDLLIAGLALAAWRSARGQPEPGSLDADPAPTASLG